MSKRAIATLWLAGTAVMIAGGAALWAAAPHSSPGGTLHDHPVAATVVLLVCGAVAVTGFALQLVAWISALYKTYRLARPTWFHVLLWMGTAGLVTSPLLLGWVIWWGLMLIYLLTAPEAKPGAPPTSPRSRPRSILPAPFTPGIDTGRRPPCPLPLARPGWPACRGVRLHRE